MARTFHISLHGRPASLSAGPSIDIDERPLATVAIASASELPSFALSFEEACERLNCLPRMFFEMDGSFFWTPGDAADCQVEGSLFDRDGRLVYVELRGHAHGEPLPRLLRCLADEPDQLLVQMMRQAVFVEVAAFLGWLASE